ncbi:hypothetical protein QBZ16_005384 [Prototheca wickerhamii]|uniref:K Homology domain-containing protein n=1 Tax=Prototheca wickerhamii TaxID=3111 RepID=A0AAD9IE72_PROWI|nr:hypothetical protein QBZ16_005384 [Prototheca wickerhamii]
MLGIQLRITLLAAGFVIGPSGASIRDVCRVTSADIRSWTTVGDARCRRPTRTFRVEGAPVSVRAASTILTDAVERYKDLCEGAYAGQSVSRIQRVHGVEFAYQPPPRSQVPNAATLKGPASRRNRQQARQEEEGADGARAAPAPAREPRTPGATLSRSAVVAQLSQMLLPDVAPRRAPDALGDASALTAAAARSASCCSPRRAQSPFPRPRWTPTPPPPRPRATWTLLALLAAQQAQRAPAPLPAPPAADATAALAQQLLALQLLSASGQGLVPGLAEPAPEQAPGFDAWAPSSNAPRWM